MRKLLIEDLSKLACGYALFNTAEGSDILVVSFQGEYGYGSRGNGDGTFIRAEIMRGLAAFEPSGVVLDFRQMRYEWGNTLLSAIAAIRDGELRGGTPHFPIVIVTSELCHDAIVSLVSLGAGDVPLVCNDLEMALGEAQVAARRWLES